jgi:hypothetical protein
MSLAPGGDVAYRGRCARPDMASRSHGGVSSARSRRAPPALSALSGTFGMQTRPARAAVLAMEMWANSESSIDSSGA